MSRLDISDVEKHCSMALRELGKFDDRMARICQRYVDKERNGHAYQNRSHMAETHTNAVRIGDNVVRCEMDVEYASYLQRTTSRQWSRFEDYMWSAIGDVTEMANKSAIKIGAR